MVGHGCDILPRQRHERVGVSDASLIYREEASRIAVRGDVELCSSLSHLPKERETTIN